VVSPITHLDFAFENNKWIKSVSWDIDAFNKRNPLLITTLSYILLSL
jgi:hypothetical protein